MIISTKSLRNKDSASRLVEGDGI